MSRRSFWMCLALALALAPPMAQAQDGVMIGGDSMMWSVPDYGSTVLAQSVMRSANRGGVATERRTGGKQAPQAGGNDLRIRYEPAVSRQVEREYLASLSRQAGPPAAERFGEYFRTHPLHGQFAIAAGPYGLRKDNLADVTAAYFTVMWMTANDAPLPTKAQVAGVRRQVGALLSAPGAVPADMAQRQRLAESLMYKLVSMILLREDAQRSGDGKALRDLAVVAARETGKGFDLKALQLSDQGLVPRR